MSAIGGSNAADDALVLQLFYVFIYPTWILTQLLRDLIQRNGRVAFYHLNNIFSRTFQRTFRRTFWRTFRRTFLTTFLTTITRGFGINNGEFQLHL